MPEKRSFECKYASFKNIKFPKGNYQTDRSETLTLHCLHCSPLNFPVAACHKTENDKNLFIKNSNRYGGLTGALREILKVYAQRGNWEHQRRPRLGGSGGTLPQKILKSRVSEMRFPTICGQLFSLVTATETAVVRCLFYQSLEFSVIYNKNGIRQC